MSFQQLNLNLECQSEEIISKLEKRIAILQAIAEGSTDGKIDLNIPLASMALWDKMDENLYYTLKVK